MKKKKQFKEYDDFTLKRIQEVELEILKDFMDICDRHGLDYFGIAGTGIGALRHHGFIPWDDDIDICMIRSDVDKLATVLKDDPDYQAHPRPKTHAVRYR